MKWPKYWTWEAWRVAIHGVAKSRTRLSDCDEDLGQRALLLSKDPLSSLPKSVCSGSGRNAKPNTYVSDMLQGVCYSPAICDSRICQPVTMQGNPLHILPLMPVGSSLLSD